MATKTFNVKGLQLRHDTASNWSSKNPVLSAGEVGVETDTGIIKGGDGKTAWNSLAYGQPIDLSGYLTIEDAEDKYTPVSHITKSGYSIGQIGASSTYGHVKLSDAYTSTLSTSSGCAATPKAVNSVYKIANAKQSPATSLSGYGITDAYTKSEVDNLIANSGGGSGGDGRLMGWFIPPPQDETGDGGIIYDLSDFVEGGIALKHITITQTTSWGDAVALYAYLAWSIDGEPEIAGSALMQGYPCILNMPTCVSDSSTPLYLYVYSSYGTTDGIEVKCYI